MIDEESCLLEILDTAGFWSVEHAPLRDQRVRDCDGIVLVYSITSPSFEQIRTFRERLLRVKGNDEIPMMLVGNKHDLEEKREVSTAEGRELAVVLGASFMETSAKTRHNVEEAFYDLVRLIRRARLGGVFENEEKGERGCATM